MKVMQLDFHQEYIIQLTTLLTLRLRMKKFQGLSATDNILCLR